MAPLLPTRKERPPLKRPLPIQPWAAPAMVVSESSVREPMEVPVEEMSMKFTEEAPMVMLAAAPEARARAARREALVRMLVRIGILSFLLRCGAIEGQLA